jgi:cation:H+ antiporter
LNECALLLLGVRCAGIGGELFVRGANEITPVLGLDEFVEGTTVVAATGTLELATTVVSILRGHQEVGLGTILGSNGFNNLFVVGVTTAITPFAVILGEVALGLMFGLIVVAALPSRGGLLERRRGALLVALYAAYLVTVLQAP